MLNLKRNYLQLGQTIAEYAILVALVLAAILAMQVYVKRTLQSRYHTASRYLISTMRSTEGRSADAPYQYEPYYTNSQFETERNSQSQTNFFGDWAMDRSVYEKINSTGTRILLPGCEATEEGCGGI